jgi:uncharacterized metal-binding protein YceD (DUF177 family)
MDHFSEYSIPILGLRDGDHQFEYRLDNAFFARFEESPIGAANLRAVLNLEKRTSMMILHMELDGTIDAICDKCTAAIDLPISEEMELIVKHNETPGEDDDVVFIHPSTSHFNVAKYFYEFAVLTLPIVNVYDCDQDDTPPCDFEVLKKLESYKSVDGDNPFRDALKDIGK